MSTLTKAKTAEEKSQEKQKVKDEAKWTLEQEELLAEWAEKASCYRWLHNKSEKQYRCRNYSFTIPVIILSTLTGTANFAMDSFVPNEQKKMAMGIVGGVNIFAGILSTLQNFLRYAELMEGHRSSGVSWSKFGRNITVELALDEKRRKPATDFLKICRAEFDRLIEQSPSIDDKIINRFEHIFKDNDIIRPEVCNGIKKCKIYKPSKEEKVTTMIADAGGKFLSSRKDHLKTAKSWKKLEVNRGVGNEQDVEKGIFKKLSIKPIPPPSSKSVITKGAEMFTKLEHNIEHKLGIDNDKAVQEPEPCSEPEPEQLTVPPREPKSEPKSEPKPEPKPEPTPNYQELNLTLQPDDNVDDFLDGIESNERP